MEPRFESQFKDVFGGKSIEEKELAKKELRDLLNEGPGDKLKSYEIELSEKEREIIDIVNAKVKETIFKFGGSPPLFNKERIFVVRDGTLKDISDGKFSGGYHSLLKQFVIVEIGKSDIEFAVSLAHELFHFLSFKSAQIFDGEAYPYRSGITVFDRKVENEYFSHLEEAIVAETTRQFYFKEIKNIPIFHTEIETLEKLKVWINKILIKNNEKILSLIFYIPRADYLLNYLEGYENKEKSEEEKLAYLHGFYISLLDNDKIALSERYKERENMYALLDEIVEKSDGRFNSREELFEEFAKANFTGNLLPLAGIIEDTLGKGSFRRIAEEFKKELK